MNVLVRLVLSVSLMVGLSGCSGCRSSSGGKTLEEMEREIQKARFERMFSDLKDDVQKARNEADVLRKERENIRREEAEKYKAKIDSLEDERKKIREREEGLAKERLKAAEQENERLKKQLQELLEKISGKPPDKKVSAMPMSMPSGSLLEMHLRMVFEGQQNYQRKQFEAYLAQKEHLATEKLKRELCVWRSEVVTYEEARKTFKNLPPRDHSYWEQYQRAKKEWERTHFPSDHEKTLAMKEIERKKALAEANARSESPRQGQVSFRKLVPNPAREREYDEELKKLKNDIADERNEFKHRLSLNYTLFERQLQLMRQAPQRPQGARLY